VGPGHVAAARDAIELVVPIALAGEGREDRVAADHDAGGQQLAGESGGSGLRGAWEEQRPCRWPRPSRESEERDRGDHQADLGAALA
ncbi:hypothetical protein, partial [Klebsiella oxytoca]|uniref:hypothetical protein n=1 Tax=Klebsiella oxytoca TaxID=571 RepID=UPI0013D58318